MRYGTLSHFRSLIRTGAHYRCVENTYKPENNDQARTIQKAQGNGWFFTVDADEPGETGRKRYWCEMPKAADILEYRTNGFGLVTWKLKAPIAAVFGPQSITLEFMADPS